MNGAKISIITVCFNAETTIARTIESVLQQTHPPYEYFVIDGQSTDETVTVAKSYEGQFKDKRIKYSVISEKDYGMYDALNKGTKLSSGELVGQINSDDWYEPTALDLVAQLYERTGFDMAYADLRMINSDGSSWIKKSSVDKFVNSRHWNHPTQFAKREIMLRHPYQCRCMSDDLDFMLWVRHNNYHVEVLSEVLANFTIEGMSHSKSLNDVLDRIRTKSLIYKQNGYSCLHTLDISIVEVGKMVLER